MLSLGTVVFRRFDWFMVKLECINSIISNPNSNMLVFQYRMELGLNGCDWHPTKHELLSFTRDDGVVFLWNYEESIVQSLIGHEGRAFQVCFNPVHHHLMASGSDDKSIIIWDVEKVFIFVMLD